MLCEMQSALSMVIWIPIGIQIQIKVPCERGDGGVVPSTADLEDPNHPLPSSNGRVGRKIQWYSQDYAEEICC